MRYTHEDGEPFSKEEFLQKLKTDNNFNDEFGNKGIDQISELIKQLKDNPDSRRLLVSVWAVHDLPNMTLPPCHYGFQCYTRLLTLEERRELVSQEMFNEIYNAGSPEYLSHNEIDQWNIPVRAISLKWQQRSCDFPLGIPFNIASYATLLEILGKMVNMVPEELIGDLGDCHIYSNQVEGVKEQIGRKLIQEERIELGWSEYSNGNEIDFDLSLSQSVSDEDINELLDSYGIPKRTRKPYPLPKLTMSDKINFNGTIDEMLNSCLITDFVIENYKSHSKINFPLSN